MKRSFCTKWEWIVQLGLFEFGEKMSNLLKFPNFLWAFVVCVVLSCELSYGYETGGGIVDGKLNVHLVPHSHDDVGWLKTVDQYFIGSNNSIQVACVENVLDSVFVSLLRDPNRKFIFAEMAFFRRWWLIQSGEIQAQVKKLVSAGRLEFVNGGWCMHYEASTHYIDMIDQTTLGHGLIKSNFNVTPRAGWQIDPFGHSAVQAYLLGAELGFDSIHFARIDYQDRAKRKDDKSLEVPIQDEPLLFDMNVEKRVNDFIIAALSQANVTRTNHIMWTMGEDFKYQYAESWFKQMDKLIHYVNMDGRVNALYSTPSIYTDAKFASNMSWPLRTHDYFPYANNGDSYWTGYFTSRPALKGYIRSLSGYYLASRQLEYLVGRRNKGPNIFSLGDALGIAQHHDAVSGTAKQHTTIDYQKRLAIGALEAEAVVNSALSCLTSSTSNCTIPTSTFSQCPLLNISFCPPVENIPSGKSLVIVAYNALGWNRTDIIRIPVKDANFVVQDNKGNMIEAQFIEFDDITSNLRSFYTEAYLGISPKDVPKYWLLFQASVPPLGWNTYFVTQTPGTGGYVSVVDTPQNDTIEIGSGSLKMLFSFQSGQLKRITNSRTGIDIPLQQSYLWYASRAVIRGPLVEEVYQQFNPWIYQVTRLYKEKEHAEFEFIIGPIPMDDGVGKEVITRITADMATNKMFYTDSNGRDFLKRVRDYREDWPLQVTQPVAGNYYPLNLGMFTTDNKTELSVLVDRATGGASINDGRMLYDDLRGVREALDEIVCNKTACQGLVVWLLKHWYFHLPEDGTHKEK
ncbi:hypothetical protein L1987_18356 [Smallanthus sonchifolius]|uniref:Uncharacterized protein n=1 Tax=Smallanthus sonchifolius TaxID=185202 RepID=A0ACB9J2Z1_9ASTR|nr:hypothetical protein L1987_18356 [Smallanthus sonchifolius]